MLAVLTNFMDRIQSVREVLKRYDSAITARNPVLTPLDSLRPDIVDKKWYLVFPVSHGDFDCHVFYANIRNVSPLEKWGWYFTIPEAEDYWGTKRRLLGWKVKFAGKREPYHCNSALAVDNGQQLFLLEEGWNSEYGGVRK